MNYYRASQVGPSAAPPAAADAVMNVPALEVRVPTLVIWGERDTALLTSNLVGLDRFVKPLAVTRIPDGTHWVVHEKPAEVNGAIRAFLQR